MKDRLYAVTNLRTIRESIYAYATFSPSWPNGELYDKVEAAQDAVQELIDEIERCE